MNEKDNPKLTKPLSSKTLEEMLLEYPESYREIAECCILIATGTDEGQRQEAIRTLKKHVPEGQRVYVTGRPNGNMIELVWTCEDAPSWQFVTEVPAFYMTAKLGSMLGYFPIN